MGTIQTHTAHINTPHFFVVLASLTYVFFASNSLLQLQSLYFFAGLNMDTTIHKQNVFQQDLGRLDDGCDVTWWT